MTVRILGCAALALTLVACGDDDRSPSGVDAGPMMPGDSGTGFDAGPGGGFDAGPGGGFDAGDGTDAGMMMSGTPNTGEACMGDGDCTGGLMCIMDLSLVPGMGISLPGGYCSTMTCTMGGSECGPNGECVMALGSAGCLRTCTSNADCREGEGYMCQALPFMIAPGMFCLPPLSGFPMP